MALCQQRLDHQAQLWLYDPEFVTKQQIWTDYYTEIYVESSQCFGLRARNGSVLVSQWGPRGPVLAPGTGDPGPLENHSQEFPAGGPRPGATRAPLGAPAGARCSQ